LTIVRVLGNDVSKEKGSADSPKWEATFSDNVIVLVDTATRPEFLDEALARDIITRVQKLRKKAGLVPTDNVHMQYRVISNPDGADVDKVISSRGPQFESALHGNLENMPGEEPNESAVLEEAQVIGNLTILLRLLTV
jgi:isoleucyl-tRNA synthetase